MALTLTTEADIIRMAGTGASSTITLSSALLITIGENAEGEFVSDTRRDWVADFADVNAYIKKKVSQAVACKAAMEIVAYDSSNYFSVSEQETLLDRLDDQYNKAVKLLSELDHNSIRSINS